MYLTFFSFDSSTLRWADKTTTRRPAVPPYSRVHIEPKETLSHQQIVIGNDYVAATCSNWSTTPLSVGLFASEREYRVRFETGCRGCTAAAFRRMHPETLCESTRAIMLDIKKSLHNAAAESEPTDPRTSHNKQTK